MMSHAVRTFSICLGAVVSLSVLSSCGQSDLAPSLREVKEIKGTAGFFAFSPDGARLVTTGPGVRVWDTQNWKTIREIKVERISAIGVTPDAKLAFVGAIPSTWDLWNLDTGKLVRSFVGHDPTVDATVAVSPDGRYGASGTGLAQRYTRESPGDFSIRIWDLGTGKCLRRLEGHIAPVGALLFLPDSNRLLSASADWTLRLWNIESGEQLRCEGEEKSLEWKSAEINGKVEWYTTYADGPSAFALSQGGKCLLRARQLWDVEDWKPLRYLGDLKEGFGNWNCGAFSPDGKRVLTGHTKGLLVLWDVATGTEICRAYAFKNRAQVHAVAFFPDGRRVISGGGGSVLGMELHGRPRHDPYMRIWELPE